MRKIFMAITLSMIMITGLSAQTINVGEKSIEVESKNIKGTTLVPLRVLSETMGAEVLYDKGVITIIYNSGLPQKNGNLKYVQITLDPKDKDATVVKTDIYNDSYIEGFTSYTYGGMHLSVHPFIDKGTTYVPFRFISERLGYDVHYENGVINLNQIYK